MSGTGPQLIAPEASFAMPAQGATARVVPIALTLTPLQGTATVTLQNMPAGQQLTAIATLYIDASDAPIPVVVQFPDTGMSIDVPAGYQGYFLALTSGLVFNVTAPLIAALQANVLVNIQAMNWPVPQQGQSALAYDTNNFASPAVFPANGRTTTIPLPKGQIYNAVVIDCSQLGCGLYLQGTGTDGQLWQVSQNPLTESEILIPATSGGSGIAAAGKAGPDLAAKITVPLTWRPVPEGGSPTTQLGGAYASANFGGTLAPGAASAEVLVPGDTTSGFGLLLGGVQFSGFAGASGDGGVVLYEKSYPADTLTVIDEYYLGLSANETFACQLAAGYISIGRSSSIMIAAQGVSITGQAVARYAYVFGSQTG